MVVLQRARSRQRQSSREVELDLENLPRLVGGAKLAATELVSRGRDDVGLITPMGLHHTAYASDKRAGLAKLGRARTHARRDERRKERENH